MPRTEHYRDPDAPQANSLVVAAVVFVQDADGRVLLIQRSDNNLWALPGGGMDIGERVGETAERETLEETGYRIKVSDLIGIYSDPDHVIAYDDGEVRQQFALLFRARLIDGAAKPSEESPRVCWQTREEIAGLDMHPSIRMRVEHGFDRRRGDVYLG